MSVKDGPVVSESLVSFQCDREELVGMLHRGRGRGAERPLGVLIIVGGPQYRVGSHRLFVLMARDLAAAGYPVLRFDYRGMGDSTGESRTFEFVDCDIRAAVDAFFDRIPGMHGIVLFGLCDAASAALMYCTSDDRVHGLIAANPWVRTPAGEARAYIRNYYPRRLLERSFWAKVLTLEFRLVPSLRGWLSHLSRARMHDDAVTSSGSETFLSRMLRGLGSFQHPILFLISSRDLTAQEFVAVCESARDWTSAVARPNVSKAYLDDADHTLSAKPSRDAAIAKILDWLQAACR